MKLLGALLVLLSGALACRRRREEELTALRLGEALYADLAVLGCRICALRQVLPEILREGLASSAAWDGLWQPLLRDLERREEDLAACWRRAVAALPERLGAILFPLGPLLSAGGERLDRAVEAARDALAEFLRQERQRQAQQGRLTAGVCLAGSCFLILMLL